MTPTIQRDAIKARLDAGEPIVLVETLRPEHFDHGHLPGAIHLHYEEVEERAAALLLQQVRDIGATSFVIHVDIFRSPANGRATRRARRSRVIR